MSIKTGYPIRAVDVGGENIKITQKTEYPKNGKISFECEGMDKIFVRIPWWCEKSDFSCEYIVENGYAVIENPQKFTVDFNMKPELYVANTGVRADSGKVALMYGPVVYCAEGVDNNFSIMSFRLDTDTEFSEDKEDMKENDKN